METGLLLFFVVVCSCLSLCLCEFMYLFKHSGCMTLVLCEPVCTLLVSFLLFVPVLCVSGLEEGGWLRGSPLFEELGWLSPNSVF